MPCYPWIRAAGEQNAGRSLQRAGSMSRVQANQKGLKRIPPARKLLCVSSDVVYNLRPRESYRWRKRNPLADLGCHGMSRRRYERPGHHPKADPRHVPHQARDTGPLRSKKWRDGDDPSTHATARGRGFAQDSAPRAQGEVPRASLDATRDSFDRRGTLSAVEGLPVGLHARHAEVLRAHGGIPWNRRQSPEGSP